MPFTNDQQRAIDSRGCSLIISAAAGSGKTSVLVERVIGLIIDEKAPVDVDRLLVVTFTNLAAAEMRSRISEALLKRIVEKPGDTRLRRQLALLFTTEEEIILGVTLSFYVVIVGMMPQNGRVVYSGCLRGAGDTRYVAMVALVSVAVLRPILTYLFCYPLNNAFPGLQIAVMGPWIAFDIDAFVRNWLLHRRIRRGKWLDIRLA